MVARYGKFYKILKEGEFPNSNRENLLTRKKAIKIWKKEPATKFYKVEYYPPEHNAFGVRITPIKFIRINGKISIKEKIFHGAET